MIFISNISALKKETMKPVLFFYYYCLRDAYSITSTLNYYYFFKRKYPLFSCSTKNVLAALANFRYAYAPCAWWDLWSSTEVSSLYTLLFRAIIFCAAVLSTAHTGRAKRTQSQKRNLSSSAVTVSSSHNSVASCEWSPDSSARRDLFKESKNMQVILYATHNKMALISLYCIGL